MIHIIFTYCMYVEVQQDALKTSFAKAPKFLRNTLSKPN